MGEASFLLCVSSPFSQISFLPSVLLSYHLSSSLASLAFSIFPHLFLPPFAPSFILSSCPPSDWLSGVFPGFYFDTMEITPPAVGCHRFDPDDNEVGGDIR